MSLARRITTGGTSLVTRRCSERRFFLHPTPQVTAISEYLLAVFSNRHEIALHAYEFLSNHQHLVATDSNGALPRFTHDLNGVLARAVNAEHGRWDHFWDASGPSYVELVEPHDVLDKIVYTITNAVSSWLVDRSDRWPGACSNAQQFVSRRKTVKRPDELTKFFGENSALPEEAVLEIVPPPGFEELSNVEFAELVEKEVWERERKLREEAKSTGKRFLGVDKILTQDPEDSPRSREPRRTRNPHVACKDPERRVAFLQALKRFRAAYREALADYRAAREAKPRAASTTEFPRGTWWMRVFHCVPCAGPP